MNLVSYDDDEDEDEQETNKEQQHRPEEPVESKREPIHEIPKSPPQQPSRSSRPSPIAALQSQENPDIIPNSESTRERIRQLTVPQTLPELPPNVDYTHNHPGQAKLNAKLAEFARLKSRSQSPLDFNLKLTESKAFANPDLANKLRDFMDIKHQYGSTLGPDIWDASKLPQRGYTHEIIARQRQLQKERTQVEFVASSNKK